jgi:hypothetical protein
MSSSVTLEHVESLAAQLSPRDRLKLVARVCDRLSAAAPSTAGDAAAAGTDYAAWAKECDEVAELWEGEFDAVADLRRIRDED